MTPPRRLIVFSPNWLGDAVMAIPCLQALRGRYPSASVTVAARAHLAPLFEMVDGVDATVPLERAWRMGGWLAAFRDARRIRGGRFDIAVLLPNSFRSAWIAWLSGVGERWGYEADGRSRLLTRAVPRVVGGHQVEYYRRLVDALVPASEPKTTPGVISDLDAEITPGVISINVLPAARERARRMLAARGWKPGDLLVGMAPGAAYGTAKQWLPARFAELASALGAAQSLKPKAESQHATRIRTVLVGSAADRPVCDRIETDAHADVINLAGATDLRELAAVISECASFVTNDSGSMHVAAAVGVPVTAIFGPTREWETGPVRAKPRAQSPKPRVQRSREAPEPAAGEARGAIRHAVITSDVACRPCMLRECPTAHECMTAIDVDRVKGEVMKQIEAYVRIRKAESR